MNYSSLLSSLFNTNQVNQKYVFKFLLLLFIISYNNSFAQSIKNYINAVDQHKKNVDSLVTAFYQIPSSNIGRIIAHYRCIGKDGGSYAELYLDSNKQPIMLTWQSNCDSSFTDKAYYFIDDKIALVMDNDLSEAIIKEKKYYQNDMLILATDIAVENVRPTDKDLMEGYRILNSLRPK